MDPFATSDLLWNTYHPYSMWLTFALIGLGSLVILSVYKRVTDKAAVDPDHTFNLHGDIWVKAFLIPIALAFIYYTCKAILDDLKLLPDSVFNALMHFLALPYKSILIALVHSLALILNSVFFTLMLVISFLPKHLRSLDAVKS
jgi:hypothetical protein